MMNLSGDIDSWTDILNRIFSATNHDDRDGMIFKTAHVGMALYTVKMSGKVEIIIALTQTNHKYIKDMKQFQNLSSADNHTAINLGKLADIKDYVLELGSDMKIPGKVFGGQAVGAAGGEFSFQVFAPGQETGFLHTHKNHEELYFFLAGKGEFQVGGKVFPVEEGSIVRVASEGKRSVRNNGTEPLVMLCVQYRGNTFTSEDAADGNILGEPVKW